MPTPATTSPASTFGFRHIFSIFIFSGSSSESTRYTRSAGLFSAPRSTRWLTRDPVRPIGYEKERGGGGSGEENTYLDGPQLGSCTARAEPGCDAQNTGTTTSTAAAWVQRGQSIKHRAERLA